MNPFEKFRESKGNNPFAKFASQQDRVIATTPDGGRVLERADGTRHFVSPGMSTNDPATVERILQGATPADVVQQGFREQALQQHPVASKAATMLRGVPFAGEYVDEAAGAMFGDKARDSIRFLQGSMDEERPGQALGLGVAGGIAGAIPMALAAGPSLVAGAPAGIGAQVGYSGLLGSTLGGAEGLVAGYGAGNEGDRMSSAGVYGAIGAGVGGVLGAMSPVAASGARKAYAGVADRVAKRQTRVPGVSREASDQLIMRARGDNIGPQSVLPRDTSMPAEAGPGMRALLDQAVNTSPEGGGAALRNVQARVGRAAPQLVDAFDSAMGGPEGAAALSRAIRDARRPGINAAYREAYGTPIDYASEAGRHIEDILDRIPARHARKAIDAATDRMIYDGAPNPQMLARIMDDGSVVWEGRPNVMQLDYMKRAFDRIAEDSKDAVTGRMSSDGAFASQIARDIRSAISDAAPSYRAALQEASDEFGLQNATRLGRDLLRRQTTRESVADWANNAGAVEKRAAAAGLRSEIDEIMANAQRAISSGNMDIAEVRGILRPLSSRANQEKIGEVLGDSVAKKVFDAAEEMADALLLQQRVAVGSGTAPRQVGDRALRESLDNAPSQIARDAASLKPLGAGQKALENVFANTPADRAGRVSGVYRELADFLTGAQGAEAQKRVGLLASALRDSAISAEKSGRAGILAAGGLGIPAFQSGTQYLKRRQQR